jgi:uncharacterized protein HemX
MIKQLSNIAIEEHLQTVLIAIIVIMLGKGMYHFYQLQTYLEVVDTRVKSSCDRLREVQRSTETLKQILELHDERYDELRHRLENIARQKARQDSHRAPLSDLPGERSSSGSDGERGPDAEPGS